MLALCRVAFPRLGQPLRTAMPGPRSEMTLSQDTNPSLNIRSALRVPRPPVHWTDRHSANRDRALVTGLSALVCKCAIYFSVLPCRPFLLYISLNGRISRD